MNYLYKYKLYYIAFYLTLGSIGPSPLSQGPVEFAHTCMAHPLLYIINIGKYCSGVHGRVRKIIFLRSPALRARDNNIRTFRFRIWRSNIGICLHT